MDVVPPPPADAPKAAPKDEPSFHQIQKQTVTKPPKQARSGVGLAIFATVVIVLGLAALMVYAYLRTKDIVVF